MAYNSRSPFLIASLKEEKPRTCPAAMQALAVSLLGAQRELCCWRFSVMMQGSLLTGMMND